MRQFSSPSRFAITWVWEYPLVLLVLLNLVGDWRPARGQSPIIAIGPPSFQTLAGPSLEDEVLYGLTFLGQREPGDLIRLARLAELRSVATLASIQNDLRGSVASVQLERESFALWNATDALDQAIWYLPPDVQNLAWSQLLLTDVEAAYGRLNSSLGGVPALSPRGAYYLEGIAPIIPFVQSELQLIEADLLPPALYPATRLASPAELREPIQLLARNLAALIKEISERERDPRRRESAVAGLTRLLEMVATFERILAVEPPLSVVWESFRQLMRGAQQTEATLIQSGKSAAWRPLRDQLNAMSDALQLPRAVGSLEPGRPVSPRTSSLLPVIDQASALVAAAQGQPIAGDVSETLPSKSGDQARWLEIKLLELRQHALTATSTDELDSRVREIEALSQQLGAQGPKFPALFRGGRLQTPPGLEQVNRAIRRLRELIGGANTNAGRP
jgi:hypothetical protein